MIISTIIPHLNMREKVRNDMREDLKLMDYAKELGFEPEVRNGHPNNGHSFVKGEAHVWLIREGWRVADLVDGYYKNHRTYPTLKEALDKEA